MRSRVLAILVAVVVPLAALGVVITQRGDSSHKPARLPILASGAGAENAALGAARADTAMYPYGVIVYKAGPNLPTLDGSARAYKIAAVDPAAMRRLADAFGLDDAAPAANFTFTDGDAQLTVSPSGYWGYTRQSAGGGVSSSGVAVACAPDTDCPIPPTTVPQHPADLPSQEDAKATALALLQRAGIDTEHATVTVDDYVTQWSVRVDPIVDGLPTEGFSNTVSVGERSVIDYANGILGRPERADEYPLIGTSAAIEKLNNGEIYYGGGPRPLIARDTAVASDTASAGASGGGSGTGSVPPGAEPALPQTTRIDPGSTEPGSVGPTEPAPPPPCDPVGAPTTFVCGEVPPDTFVPPPPQEITLTGAEQLLTFAPSYDGSESWLVPAYRFTTTEGVGPTVLAIDDSFLAPPPDQIPTGKGSTDPGGPVTIEPQPAPEPAQPAPEPAVKEPSTGS